jgi:SAM-dependent methyltransferase
MKTTRCSICGHSPLMPGPRGRKSATGLDPHCPACESLERHRIIHHLMSAIPEEFLSWRRAIQFSPDPSLQSQRFRHMERSNFGGDNSIDIQNIGRRDGSFDFIAINHVLESVPDDRKAFAELVRVLSPQGVLQVTYGGVLGREESMDLPQPEMEWRALHRYGRDVGKRFRTRELGLSELAVLGTDPCTSVQEVVHFYFRDPGDAVMVQGWISAFCADAVLLA